LAKPNYQFEKRQRDLAKKQKQEEKRRQKLAGKSAADGEHDPASPQVETETMEGTGGVDQPAAAGEKPGSETA